MYFQRKVQTFYLLRESVNAILYSTKSGKFQKTVEDRHCYFCVAFLWRRVEPITTERFTRACTIYNRISTLRFLFITALLELRGKYS